VVIFFNLLFSVFFSKKSKMPSSLDIEVLENERERARALRDQSEGSSSFVSQMAVDFLSLYTRRRLSFSL